MNVYSYLNHKKFNALIDEIIKVRYVPSREELLLETKKEILLSKEEMRLSL